MKELTDIQREDKKYFRWCLVRNSVDRKFAKQLNFKGVKFRVHKREYAKIEKQNSISISMFGYEDKTPCHINTSNKFLRGMLTYYSKRILKIPITFNSRF